MDVSVILIIDRLNEQRLEKLFPKAVFNIYSALCVCSLSQPQLHYVMILYTVCFTDVIAVVVVITFELILPSKRLL